MSKLPLAIRKAMRDFGKPKEVEILESLKRSTGKDWTIEVDLHQIKDELEKRREKFDNMVEIIYGRLLPKVAEHFEKVVCVEPLYKEELLNICDHCVLRYKLFEKNTKLEFGGFIGPVCENGEFQLVAANYFNISDTKMFCGKNNDVINYFFMKYAKAMPVCARKMLKDNEEKLAEHVKKISQVTGIEFTLNVDWEKIDTTLKTHKKTERQYRNYVTQQPFGLIRLLGKLTTILEKACGDEMVKEELPELFTKKEITYDYDPDCKKWGGSPYIGGEVVDGVLVLKMILWNCSESKFSFDVEKLL